MSERVTIQTEDGVIVVGTWVDAGGPAPAILLLHMMPATKESYAAFQEKLREAGYSSMAIDFRGHGDSLQTADGRVLNYKKFSDAEHQASIRDVEAARSWMLGRGVAPGQLGIVGASIGANLALQAMSGHPDIPAGVILSPGLNYRGVVTMPLVQALSREQSIYLVASADDRESAKAVEKLAEVSLAKTDVKLFDAAGHGTSIFEREPAFMDEAIAWIRGHIK